MPVQAPHPTPVIDLLSHRETLTINVAARELDLDPRTVRIMLLDAAAHGLVSVDADWHTWRLAEHAAGEAA